MLPTPVLSYSSIHTYKRCPGAYYLSYVDPERFLRPPLTSDLTGTLPGNVVHRLMDLALPKNSVSLPVVDSFKEDTYLSDELLVSLIRKELDNPRVALHSEHEEKWAMSLDTAIIFIRDCRNRLLATIKEYDLFKAFMLSEFKFGTFRNPCVINDQLLLAGAVDLFAATSATAKGAVYDFKASKSTYYLDRDQLKVYRIALERHKFAVGSAGFILFKIARKPIFYAFPESEIKDTIERFVGVSKAIQDERFEFTPSVVACKLCDYRDDCEKVILTDDARELVAGMESKPWETPEL